jgi:hypothetical protein
MGGNAGNKPMNKLSVARRKLSRRRPKEFRVAAGKHARQIGEIALAWNALQHSFFVLFYKILNDYPRAHAIWHSLKSDRAQREMLLSVAIVSDRLPKSLIGHLAWAVRSATKLSEFRNIVIHTPVMYLDSSGRVLTVPNAVSAKRSTVKRLRIEPIAKRWRLIRGDLIILTDFCHAIYEHIVVGGLSASWPHRPTLLAIPKSNRIARRAPPARAAPRPRRRPRASLP